MTEETCDLCVGKCRGHSLGSPDQWEPEVGSRAHAQDIVERLTVAQKWVIMDDHRLCKLRPQSQSQVHVHTRNKGLTDQFRRLTPLGLSIRKLLEKQNG